MSVRWNQRDPIGDGAAGGLRDDALRPGAADAGDLDADQLAAAQFVHGLLEHVGRDDAARQERRVAAVLRAIEREEGRFRVARPTRRWLVAATMLLAALLATSFLAGIPGQNEAYAAVRASIAATRVAGDRSFTVRAVLPDASFQPLPPARLDIRDDNHQVFTATTPRGDVFVVGRNERGTWAIRPDGSIDLYPPRHAWPRWMDFGEITFLADSTDDVLARLPEGFTLRAAAAEAPPDGDGPLCDRISAERRDARGPDPTRIELWIDRDSRLVRRMELHWPERDIGPGGPCDDTPELLRKPRGGRLAGPRGGGPDDGGRGGPNAMDRGGDGMPPPPGGRPDFKPRFNPSWKPDGAPPGDRREPRDVPVPPRDGGPNGCGDGPPPPGSSSDGLLGVPPPPGGGARRGPPHRTFVDGPPTFGRPGHPPPPKTIIFELRDTPEFDDSWFEPTAHARRE